MSIFSPSPGIPVASPGVVGSNSDGTGGSKKNAPAPPPFQEAAEAQARSSADATNAQTAANRPNQSTPFASSQWTQLPNGQWMQSTGFAGGLGNLASSLTGQAQQSAGQPLDFGGVPALTSGADAREQAITSAYGAATSRLDPAWQQREEGLRTRLLNQGLSEGSEAYQNAMGNLGRERTDAYNQALASAIGQGTAAGQALFGQSLAGRQQGISEALQRRALPLAEIGQLTNFLHMPSFQGAGAAQPTQFLPAALAAGDYAMRGWQAQQQADADRMRGVFDLIGGIIPG